MNTMSWFEYVNKHWFQPTISRYTRWRFAALGVTLHFHRSKSWKVTPALTARRHHQSTTMEQTHGCFAPRRVVWPARNTQNVRGQ